ncbi:hypothetical protein B7463_g2123, partial [Scytalidium lignicola]
MFASKGFFSGILCPSEEACALPKCTFKHVDLNTDLDKFSIVSESDRFHLAVNPEVRDNERVKRRKINDASSTHKTGAAEANNIQKGQPLNNQGESTSLQTKTLQTVNRQVSPPPLRRNTETIKSSSTSQTPNSIDSKTPVKKASTTTKSTSTIVSHSITTLNRRLERKEALNPRALKSTPASHTLRFQLVKALHDQFVRLNSELAKDANDVEQRLVLSDQALITKVLDIEEDAAGKASIYSNVVKNSILNYKRMTVVKWKEEREKELADLEALEALASSNTTATKPASSPKPIETGLTPEEELVLLPKLFTPIDGLSKHGYVNSIPSDEDINIAKYGVEASKGWEVCDRCKSRFQVFPGRREEDGALTSGGPCRYHFGKAFMSERSTTDVKSKREKRYGCCGQAIGDSPGCTQADSHVFKVTEFKRLAAVMNFERTPENPNLKNKDPVCIDAEMGYTTYGLELIRLTATSWNTRNELLDVLVRPMGEVLDLNSRYSGVWPKDMTEAKPLEISSKEAPQISNESNHPTNQKLPIVESPASARALLFSYLSPQTPLIGHGLENDLNATRIIHPTIIDTALLYPHKAGLPFRHGLKMLMRFHLNREIQVVVDGNMTGHDSKEDANAAGDLVRYAVGREWAKLKNRGWTFENGKLKSPEEKFPPSNRPKASHSVESFERDSKVISTASKATRKRSRAEIEDPLEDGEVDDN